MNPFGETGCGFYKCQNNTTVSSQVMENSPPEMGIPDMERIMQLKRDWY